MQTTLFNTKENILPSDGEAYFYPHFFTRSQSDIYLKQLTDEVPWKQEPIKIIGREVMQPRLTAWYGDTGKTYTYSGITMQPYAWTDSLLQIKTAIEKKTGCRFTNALLNFYRDGKDSMGWHRDNEKELGPNPVIGSVNFGATRKFQFRYHREKNITRSIDLSHGSLLLMKGATQHYWEHQLPKTKKETAARINITFRIII